MPRVFLSFHSHDTNLAAKLTGELESRGHSVVRYDQSIAAGVKWEDEIRSALRTVDAVVIVVTTQSSKSQWVMHEAGMAIGYMQERGRPLVIPVVVGDVEIPGPLASIQALRSPEDSLAGIADKLDQRLQVQVGRLHAQAEHQREVARRVEANASEYISRSRLELDRREVHYRRVAYLWYCLAFCALSIGVGFAAWRASILSSLAEWIHLVEFIVLSLAVVGLLIGLSKLSFGLGKSFMVEALRNADRSHAISFGEFYLKAYGEQAEWTEVKDAFQHWNVDKGSSFATQDSRDLDPQLMHAFVEIAKTLQAGATREK